MSDFHFQTPVLFIIFNRPDKTAEVFERIRAAKPPRLYVSSDAARSHKANEAELVVQTRKLVLEGVDWECEVITRLYEQNQGCRRAVSGAVSWFFENEPEGIVLEDDCLPDMTFFRFCQECLEKYRDDDRVFHINGLNVQFGWVRDPDYSYYFSRFNSIWGWASWRRAWRYYDVAIPLWKEVREKGYFLDMALNRMDAYHRAEGFEAVHSRGFDTWDYQWSFTIQANSGIVIVPNTNMIFNIGFDETATHTKRPLKYSDNPALPIQFPLRHPPFMIADKVSDERQFSMYNKRGYTWRLKHFRKLYLGKR